MTEIKTLLNFLSKLTIKDIGIHLSNVALLYASPRTSYRKLVKNEYESYRFFILFILYYAFLAYFLVENPKYIIPLTLLEVVLTLFPFSFLIIPFIIFRKKYAPRVKYNGLFRLTFVVKLQFGVFLILAILLARWTRMESIYIFIENYTILLFVPLICALPYALNIKISIKFLWIFLNYLFSLLYLMIFGFIVSSIPDSEFLYEKIAINSPDSNYTIFQINYNLSDLYLSDRFIAFSDNKGYFIDSQFPSNPAVGEILRVSKLDLEYRKRKVDSLLDKNTKYWPSGLSEHPFLLSKTKMDSIKLNFNEMFYEDIRLVDSLRKSEPFTSNKMIYNKIFKLLKYHDSIHKSNKFKQQILNQTSDIIIRCNPPGYVLLYPLEDQTHKNLSGEITKLRASFEKRSEQSSFIAKLYLFPILKVFE